MSDASERLKKARERAGYDSAKAAADAMGIPVATYLQHENGTRGFPASKAQRYARRFRTSPEWLLYGTKGRDTVITTMGPTLYVVGKVAAGVWATAWELPEGDRMAFIGRPDVRAPLDKRFGVLVEGESMNELYPPGTILECVSFLGGVEISSGKRVIVQRQRSNGDFEVTVKEYLVDREGVEWLVPRSSNPNFQTPVRVDSPGPDIIEVQIIGVVVASTRLE